MCGRYGVLIIGSCASQQLGHSQSSYLTKNCLAPNTSRMKTVLIDLLGNYFCIRGTTFSSGTTTFCSGTTFYLGDTFYLGTTFLLFFFVRELLVGNYLLIWETTFCSVTTFLFGTAFFIRELLVLGTKFLFWIYFFNVDIT